MKNRLLFIILLIIAILPVSNLFHSGIPATHDGPDHVARIANFYKSLTEGNVVPRWAANLNWGYGHPILMFLYPLPSYLASALHGIGMSFVDSAKLVFGLSYVVSVLMFFVWANKQWNPIAGFIGALIYGFSPYRFVDLNVRGDIGENMAFLLPPFIFWGLLSLAKNESRFAWTVVSIGVFALITAHNAIALMVMPLIIFYTIYLGIYSVKSKRDFCLKSGLAILLGFMLSAFFWIPALLEGKYTLRNIVTHGDFSLRFVQPIQFLYSQWSYGTGNDLSKELGILTWLAIAGGILLLFKLRQSSERLFISGTLLISGISLWLMTSGSAYLWNHITILQNFQFPWRFLAVLVVTGASLGSLVASKIKSRYIWAAVTASLLIVIIDTQNMWKPDGYIQRPESSYAGIYNSTTDTGESSPIWSIRFMELRPAAPMQVISGKAVIKQISRNTTRHIYSLDASIRSRIVENTLYFPGWKILADGIETPIEFQDPAYRGLMTFWVNPGQHRVVVEFTETKLRLFADYFRSDKTSQTSSGNN